uniref:Sulfhydryl oxidase n=1 Tax=Panagrolaimus sp. JU765 TaxID=591449 RepID=A0AC34RBK3_9BILA
MHAVTVQAYLDEKDNPNFKPVVEVLEPIHQFIYRYLSCEICAKNFHKMAVDTNALSHVTRSEDAVLWLWRAHNSANKRLSKDASEDPSYPKRQFPPDAICHDCQQNGVFLEEKVLSFMIRYYTDIRTDGVVASFVFETLFN